MFIAQYHPRVAIWLGGSAPFSESITESSFNGEWGVHYVTQIGAIGELKAISPRATISNDLPSNIAASFLSSGKEFWLFGMKCYGRYNFFELVSSLKFEINIIPESKRLNEDPFPDCILLQIRVNNAFSTECFWLDPKKEYALRRREYNINDINGKETGTKMVYEVLELQEMEATGIYYPKIAKYDVYVLGKHKESHKIKINKLEINNILDESDFTLKLPEGTSVFDERIGISFQKNM